MPSTKPRSTLSLTEQLALLENPTPTDFDPEALEQENWDGQDSNKPDGSSDEGEYDGREHYVVVGYGEDLGFFSYLIELSELTYRIEEWIRKSKLRKGHAVHLDPKYNGARVSRDKLYGENGNKAASSESGGIEDEEAEGNSEESGDESTGGVELDSEADIRGDTSNVDEDDEIGSDDALGSEEERFAGYKFRGSLSARESTGGVNSSGESSGAEGSENKEDKGSDSDEASTEGEENEGGCDEKDDEEGDEDEDGGDGREEEMAQRDQLRKMMVEEQKNVIANISKAARADVNKGIAVRRQQKTFDSFLSIRIKLQKALISINSLPGNGSSATISETWNTAEKTVLDLWNVLHNLRSNLSDSQTGSKRGHDGAGESTTEALWAKMRRIDRDGTPWRDNTLEKWSAKTAGVTATPLSGKLNNNVSAPRTLTASLCETLSSDADRLIARTRTPRSMAPTCASGEEIEIFDDTDFYQLLLKALVDQRMIDGNAAAGSGAVRWTTAMRDSKKKKVVDTKASKGRKLRYQVQEKIQNFMAPMDNNRWHEQQIDELFSSLLGQKIEVDEECEDKDEEDVEMDGLRLFRS